MNCPINFYISRDELGELKSLINTITNSKARRNRKQAILRLRRSQNKILEYIGQNQSVSPSDLSDRFSYSSRGLLNYSNAKRYLRELSQLKLIEIDRQRISETENNKKRYYKLSGAGIYYLISKNKNLVHGILKNIIIYNHNHILFKLFLYVCIEYDTLYAITDTSVFLRVCEYLHNCCKDIEHMFEYIDKTYNSRNGYLIDQIFVWNNIPRMDYDTNALRDFLKQKFSFDWLGKSTVEKTGDGNGIRITVGLKTMLLSLNKEKTKAVLSYRGKKSMNSL
jgi:hypothetical protein